MRYAIISNGIVENIIESDVSLPGLEMIADDGTAQIGGSWDGVAFHPAPTIILVPQSVTRFQALAALSNAGLLTSAQNAVNASTNPLVPLAWNNAQEFVRSSPTIAALASAMGLTNSQIDDLFIAASKITA